MCPPRSAGLRRLEEVISETEAEIVVSFTIQTEDQMNVLLSKLQDPEGSFRFKSGAGIPESSDVTLMGFVFTPSASSPSSSNGGGVVNTLVDLQVSGVTSSAGRRLLENLELASAIEASFKELIPLPSDAAVACAIIESSATTDAVVRGNVSITVNSDIGAVQASVASFLQQDSGVNGARQLPALISSMSGIVVEYTPGFVPIVWSTSDGSPLEKVLNMLPYVLAGIGVISVVIAVLVCRYRLVIRSTLKDIWNGRWSWPSGRDAGGWTGGRYAARFLEREKSDEVSSTPDTATNVDDEEFDIDILRENHNSHSSAV